MESSTPSGIRVERWLLLPGLRSAVLVSLLLVDAALALGEDAKLLRGRGPIHSMLVFRVGTVLPMQLLGFLGHALRFVVDDAVDQQGHEISRDVSDGVTGAALDEKRRFRGTH